MKKEYYNLLTKQDKNNLKEYETSFYLVIIDIFLKAFNILFKTFLVSGMSILLIKDFLTIENNIAITSKFFLFFCELSIGLVFFFLCLILCSIIGELALEFLKQKFLKKQGYDIKFREYDLKKLKESKVYKDKK